MQPSRRKPLLNMFAAWLLAAGAGLQCQTPETPRASGAEVASAAEVTSPVQATSATERANAALPRAAASTPATLYLPEAADSTPEAAPTPQPAPAADPKAKRPFRVAAVGDSLTDERSGGGLYLEALRKRCPESTFDNYGVGGDMVNQMRRRFPTQVLSRASQYSHVLIFGGVNDLYSDLTAGRTPAKIEQDLAWMYMESKRAGLGVIALTVAPWGGFKRYFNAKRSAATQELNAWILSQEAVATSDGAAASGGAVDAVIDAYPLLSCGNPEHLCPEFMLPFKDGLHFGKGGHEVLATALFEKVFVNCR